MLMFSEEELAMGRWAKETGNWAYYAFNPSAQGAETGKFSFS